MTMGCNDTTKKDELISQFEKRRGTAEIEYLKLLEEIKPFKKKRMVRRRSTTEKWSGSISEVHI